MWRYNDLLAFTKKQTHIATSSNHAEVIALHKASRECVWPRSVTQHIQTTCGLPINRDPTILFEDNAASVAQMKEGFIKSDRTKHIPPSSSHSAKNLKRIRKFIFNISDQVIMRQISLQRHFPLQLSKGTFEILGCVICEIYEEELLMST